ncbi:PilZ domain-containing protein [Colwellia sp. M166]|uniref:PilZ domain-containing protein n=1 Tax=Colwellia sp. M166 TaxID=2583805 RepID=UPI00211F1316|nr:PilZ domain-containing protein [Colwellia sp. M166]UUO22905.1 PilZ domain-containing protein [Colwellia sp. M166]|tara:strand:- start:5887 stop:6498 length:612 start_codon:yes stop_codon:yes gene_type:complete
MTTAEDQTKLAQFDEFFSISYAFNINAKVIELTQLPNYQQFLSNMPIPFKIASEISTLDQSALRPLQTVAGVAGQLMEYLNYQAQKMDLLVGYILAQEDNVNARFKALKFGGGGIIFNSDNPSRFNLGDFLELKLFFPDENSALYCIGEIISTELLEQQTHHKVIFHHIREEDQEALVRNSLHQQSKQLQALAQQRNQAKSTN